MSFRYRSRLRKREFRLVKVIGGNNSPLQVQLAVHQLFAVEFDALSYVWGDPSDKLEILCNGQPFGVTKNLHSALLERRRRGLESLLWIDALCIDQSDTDERTQQVRMMKDIYSAANTVIIWLGPDELDDEEGIELAESIYRDCDGISFDIDSVREGVTADDFNYHKRGLPSPFIFPTSNRHPGWMSIFGLLEHSWFTRAWVIQELLVAKQAIIWRGRLDLNPKVILFLAVLVDTKRDLWLDFERYTPTGTCNAINIATLYFKYKKKGPQPFWDTLCLCRNMQASDLRDKYFALVGISSGLEYELVDYNKTLCEVHAQVGYICLLGLPERGLFSIGLDLLAIGHYRDHMSPTFGMVSWVPGLISASRFAVTIADAYPTAELCDMGLGYTAARHGSEFRFLGDMEQTCASTGAYPVPLGLEVLAYPIDCIKSIARLNPSILRGFDTAAARVQTDNVLDNLTLLDIKAEQSAAHIVWLLELRRLAHQSSDEDFWRTLVYNRDRRLRPAPESLGDSFARWYQYNALLVHDYFAKNQATLIHEDRDGDPSSAFQDAWSNLSNQRAFFCSEGGRIGWVPLTARPGDRLYVFKGMRVPVVMRPLGNSGWWQLVGACYIHELMDGEAEDMAQNKWQWLKIW